MNETLKWSGRALCVWLFPLMFTGTGCGDDLAFDPNQPMSTASTQNPGGTAPTTTAGKSTSSTSSSMSMADASSATSSESSEEDTTTKNPDCVGVDPEAEAGDSILTQRALLAAVTPKLRQDDCVEPACVGSDAPFWQLHDYQPLSCGHNQDYGIKAFMGRTVLISMLSAW